MIRLEVHLLAADLATHEPAGRQQFQLALNCTDRTSDVPRELPQVVRFVGMAQKPGEYTPSGAAKEDGCRVACRWGCSRDGDNRIRNGNTRSTVQVASRRTQAGRKRSSPVDLLVPEAAAEAVVLPRDLATTGIELAFVRGP